MREVRRTKRSRLSRGVSVLIVALVLIIGVVLPANSIGTLAKEDVSTTQDSAEAWLLRSYYEREILPTCKMADLSAKTKVFDIDSERETRWTKTIGIASAEICDLDEDGKDELFVAVLDEDKIFFFVYEVENDTVIKKSEDSVGRWSDMAAHEEILTLIHTEGHGNYLLLTRNAHGVMEDFYEEDMQLYRYDGKTLYLTMAIWQTDGGSDDFEYTACRYTNQGKMISEEIVYGEDENGEYLDREYYSTHVKELFLDYGIHTCDQPDMIDYDGSFESIIKSSMDKKVLMELRIWSSSNYVRDEKRTEYIYHFNEVQYLLPGSAGTYLTEEDLAGLSAGELRLARNEIYARHDLIFQDKALTDYFTAKGYYHPINKSVPDTALNQYEIANRNLIISMENRNN